MSPRRERVLVLSIFLLLFLVAGFVADRLGQPGAGHLIPAAGRRPMADLALIDLRDQPWSLRSHHGQVVLINLWATWCQPCQEETPGLVRLGSSIGADRLAILGLSLDAGGHTDANLSRVNAFVTHFHVPYPIAFPQTGSQMEFGVDGIPTTILVDREGRVAKTYLGAVRQTVFAADVQQLLAER